MQSAHDTGVMSWVTSGRCDLVADIRFPRDQSDIDLSTIVADIVDQVGNHLGHQAKSGSKEEAEEAESARKGARIPGRQSLTKSALEVPKGWKVVDDKEEQVERERLARATSYALAKEGEEAHEADGDREKEIEDRRVSIDLDIRFKDLKASVPVSRFLSRSPKKADRADPVLSSNFHSSSPPTFLTSTTPSFALSSPSSTRTAPSSPFTAISISL
jgi:mitochondrial distribution and morphology protein 31